MFSLFLLGRKKLIGRLCCCDEAFKSEFELTLFFFYSFAPTQVKWGDTHGGYGEHFYDYNHNPPKYEHKPEPVYHPEPYKPPHH